MSLKLELLVTTVLSLVAARPLAASNFEAHSDGHDGLRIGSLINRFVPGRPFRSEAKGEATADLKNWFDRYDHIRRQAQMTAAERAESDRLQDKGVFVLLSSSDKQSGRALLNKMVIRYRKAAGQMESLPRLAQTEKLRRGYSRYFRSAGKLFGDYLTVYGNVFAKDASGQSIRKKLKTRKAALQALEASNKALDERLRARYRIPAYKFSA